MTNTKTILITGGAGFIGINAAKYYLDKDYNVIVFDNFSRKGSRDNIKWLLASTKKKPKIVEADVVKNKKELQKLVENVDIVFHFAAQVAVTTSIKKPMFDFNVNLLGTLNVLEAIRKSKKRPILLYSSTNKVYGDLTSVEIVEGKTRYKLKKFPNGISENHPVDFKSPYGCSKGSADFYIQDYHRIYGLKTVVFRQSCIYGPQQFGIEDQGWVAWFIIALLSGKNISIYGDGKQVRDLLYIDDLTRAFDMAIKYIDKTNGQIYNIGGGMQNSISIWRELRPTFEKLFKKTIDVKFEEARPGDQKFFVADITKSKKDFNWVPKVGIEEGIATLYRWAEKNKAQFKAYIK